MIESHTSQSNMDRVVSSHIWRPYKQDGEVENRWKPSGTGAFRAYKRKVEDLEEFQDDGWNTRTKKLRSELRVEIPISPPTYFIGSEILDNPFSHLLLMPIPLYSPNMIWPTVYSSPILTQESLYASAQVQESLYWTSSRSEASSLETPPLQNCYINDEVARINQDAQQQEIQLVHDDQQYQWPQEQQVALYHEEEQRVADFANNYYQPTYESSQMNYYTPIPDSSQGQLYELIFEEEQPPADLSEYFERQYYASVNAE